MKQSSIRNRLIVLLFAALAAGLVAGNLAQLVILNQTCQTMFQAGSPAGTGKLTPDQQRQLTALLTTASRLTVTSAIVILLLITVAFSLGLSVWVDRPIQQILNAFEHIQADPGLAALSQPQIRQYSELDLICRNFRTLYQELEHKRAEVQLHSREMEHLVSVRTAELEQANQSLQEHIEALKHIQEQDKVLQVELERSRKLEAVGNLASGVAHDLNNILSSFVNYPELMLMELPADSPVIPHIAAIKKAGERAASMVQDLMTLARKGVALQVPINTDILFIEFMASPECKSLGLNYPKASMKFVKEEHLPNIMGVPFHLTKSIMNLMTNAMEAMNGSGNLELHASTVYFDAPWRGYETIPAGKYVSFSVIDTGIGMDSGVMERLFEPFFTKKVLGRRSGTGLGMSVVYSTIKEHGGFIDIESTPGKGSTITLFVPPTDQTPPEARADVPLDQFKGQGEIILVVDDLQEQRDLASQLLRRIGYKPTVCSNGENAVEYIRYNKVDLVVLDMLMDPGIDGYETCQRMKRIRPDLPVIIASGYAENHKILALQEEGIKGFLKKPYRAEELGLAIRQALGSS